MKFNIKYLRILAVVILTMVAVLQIREWINKKDKYFIKEETGGEFFDYGTVKDLEYYQEYLGLHVTLPEEWKIEISGNPLEKLIFPDSIAGKSNGAPASSVYISRLIEGKAIVPDTSREESSFYISVHKMTYDSIQTAGEFLKRMMNERNNSWVSDLYKEMPVTKVNDKEFPGISLFVAIPEMPRTTECRAIRVRDYMILICMTSQSEKAKAQMNKMFNSIMIDK